MRIAILTGAVLGLAACSGGADGAIRQIGGTTLVSDTEGATLVIDENGCQSVMPDGSRVADPVRDADGQQVCLAAET